MSCDVVPGGLSTDLKERVMLSQNNVVKNIADVLLQRVRIEGGVVYKLLCRNHKKYGDFSAEVTLELINVYISKQ